MLLSKNGRAKKSVQEATEILKQYGLSSSENVTRRLIREGKLKAMPAGKVEGDKRSGYDVLERDIYKYVTEQIPIMKEFFTLLEQPTEQKNTNKVEKVEGK